MWKAFCAAIVFPILLPAGSIEGTVTNRATGEAVARVKVRFVRQNQRFDAETDSNGEYRIANLKDGEYSGAFTRYGFSDQPVNRLAIAGEAAVRRDAQLAPWGTLRGRVTGEDGKPTANVRVELSREVDNQASTDANGEFAFTEVAPGRYTVVAKPEEKTPIYYPSATELEDAIPIAVGDGTEVSGIAIRLRSVPVHRVAGVVLDDAGKPVAHAVVKLLGHPGRKEQFPSQGQWTLHVDEQEPAPELAHVVSGENGAFELPAVREGDWRLSVQTGAEDERTLAAVVDAKVRKEDLEGLDVRLVGSFAVEVSVDFGDAEIPSFAKIASDNVSISPMEGQPGRLRSVKEAGRIGDIFPGRYLVMQRFLGPVRDDWYLSAILLDGRDVRGQTLELGPGASLRAVFKPGAGTLRGTAKEGEGSTVFLVPHEGGDVVVYQEERSGIDGKFEFGPLAPGDYYVVAFDHTDGRGLPAGNLPGSIVPMATSVRVEAGSTASVEVRVNRWPW